MKRAKTAVISGAMRELARTIQSADGVANAACEEAADRLDEQEKTIKFLVKTLKEEDYES